MGGLPPLESETPNSFRVWMGGLPPLCGCQQSGFAPLLSTNLEFLLVNERGQATLPDSETIGSFYLPADAR